MPSQCRRSLGHLCLHQPWSHAGEVVGVLGHNGAGKSVLMKMLSGALERDSGEIRVRREPAHINNPATPATSAPAPSRP